MASDGATVAALSRIEGIRYRLRLGGCGGAEGVKNKTICWELFRGLICRPKRAFSSWEIAAFPFKLSKHNFIVCFVFQNATPPVSLVLGEPIRTVTSARQAGKKTSRTPVSVRRRPCQPM